MDKEFWASFSHDPRDAQYQSMRASDQDRGVVQQALTEGYADGRLDREEFDERMDRATQARTLGELAPIVSDLVAPTRLTPSRSGLAHATPDEIHRRAVAAWRSDVREAAAGFLIPSLICLVIWSLVMWGEFFWPGFVMLGTGINLLQTAIRRDDLIASHERKLERKQAKELGQPWKPNDKASE
ncbi:DUF1707 domain-containing protein [Nocardioides conyzicola]|uniref:DUF1707 SHOCT-like domain-containing protein n=1 Tax=Nocardioides conyzicola TaxID=1651781 RepID=UPI0031E6AA6F